ncbi:TetR family transcriptional regulator C-terminal domain-containing protein [Streptomyces sp. NPDC051320]|uniref:TetR/AcrR family transcriptional regulator n=1 Tax=Streptomyces sp. NPDC051320 TaxID=3154644 RepID=UPI003447AE22
MAGTEAPAQRLTAKGLATRERIVEAAATLIYQHGVQNTNNEAIRRATGVSGSQLSRHFPTKESLVRAVIAWRADSVIRAHRIALGNLDSFAALRLWADSCIEREDLCRGGCSFGSLASEVLKTGPEVRDDLADGFDRWEDLFRAGLRAMRDGGELSAAADPEQLTHVLMAAFQGGMLLGQAAASVEPLRAALNGAIAYIETFATGRPGLTFRVSGASSS